MSRHYDAIIIGAGMSGLAAGIRLAMFGKKVCIVEKHTIAGGLNSFYARKGRKLDVGLHAMTNYAPKGSRGKPLTKLLKQLRIPHSEFKLNTQSFSKVQFSKASFEFTNDANDFVTNLKELFPHESNNLDALLEEIKSFNETSLDNPYESAKEKVATFIKDKDMIEMIFCPLLIYGSAWENDMDYSQFVIMFKSIFLEGFARPEGGVRTIIRLLLKKYKDLGGEILYKNGVEKLLINENQMTGVTLESGEELTSSKVLSSVGLPETYKLAQLDNPPPVGKLSFCEIILCYKEKPQDLGIKETIVFYNENEVYEYRKPQDYFDAKSAVVCLPNNFEIDDYDEGMIRLTFMANYEKWMGLSEEDYLAKKDEVLRAGKEVVKKLYPQLDSPEVFSDVFTPKTIEKFTSHFGGTVYGSTEKSRDGKTPVDGLYIIGTDQGFLGIVGAMLSGISMANLHVLMPAESDNNAVL